MILIADAGATKIDWRLLRPEGVVQFASPGFNPRTHSLEQLTASLPESFVAQRSEISRLYFYGAGLNDSLKAELKDELHRTFANARIEVETDALGAARSLLDRQRGLVCILGTGSAVVLYDGQQIIDRVPSLGYLVGDEGSGVQLGKQFIKAYLRGFLPEQLHKQFEKQFGPLSETDFLSRVYSEAQPNTYLASFAAFVLEHQSNPFCYQLIHKVLSEFFEGYRLNRFESKSLAFCGSVAHFASNILRKVAREHGFLITLIAQSPIAGLTLYHQRHG